MRRSSQLDKLESMLLPTLASKVAGPAPSDVKCCRRPSQQGLKFGPRPAVHHKELRQPRFMQPASLMLLGKNFASLTPRQSSNNPWAEDKNYSLACSFL